jgi:hypothetical protein
VRTQRNHAFQFALGTNTKIFFTHVDDATLLPAWNGLQVDDFMLALEDDVPGGKRNVQEREYAARQRKSCCLFPCPQPSSIGW